MRVEYKKAPDLATQKELCDQTRGRRSLAWEEAKPKRISNIQANFRRSWRRRRRASPNTAIPFSSRKPDYVTSFASGKDWVDDTLMRLRSKELTKTIMVPGNPPANVELTDKLYRRGCKNRA